MDDDWHVLLMAIHEIEIEVTQVDELPLIDRLLSIFEVGRFLFRLLELDACKCFLPK